MVVIVFGPTLVVMWGVVLCGWVLFCRLFCAVWLLYGVVVSMGSVSVVIV